MYTFLSRHLDFREPKFATTEAGLTHVVEVVGDRLKGDVLEPLARDDFSHVFQSDAEVVHLGVLKKSKALSHRDGCPQIACTTRFFCVTVAFLGEREPCSSAVSQKPSPCLFPSN